MTREATDLPATTSLDRAPSRLNTFIHALLFVLGFGLVFVVGWGGAATVLGSLFVNYKTLLGQLGGVLVILFGLHTLGLLRLRWLDVDTRAAWDGSGRGGRLSSAFMGVVFAAGWTPCIGATLGAILTLGMSQQTSWQAMVLASGYALGLGLPFLAISLVMGRAFVIVRRLRRYTRQVRLFSGLLLLSMGFLLLTNRLFYIAIWAQRNGFYLDPWAESAATPTYLIAIIAGLLSFLSPCVLPLVPAYVGYLSGQATEG
jgi:cytochrome c-type biogenesis protein